MRTPTINTIEFTNACNFNCRYCQRNNEDGKRKLGFLSVDVLKKLDEQNAFSNTLYLEVQQNGEPTLHPKFTAFVDFLSARVKHIGMSTNGSFIRAKDSEEILKGVRLMDLITISIHPETRQSDIEEISKRLEGYKTKIRVQTLEHNFYDINENAVSRLSNVMIDDYPMRSFGEDYGEKKFCADLFYSVTIQWDGDVVPCCNCVGKQKVLGNVLNESLCSIFSRFDGNLFDYCQTCRTSSPFSRRLTFFDNCINV